jgi:uncharacterized protein
MSDEKGYPSFDWDPEKASLNFRKHGIRFEEAAFVFSDPLGVTIADTDHSIDEDRWITIGSFMEKILVVVFSYPDKLSESPIRLISARLATVYEKKYYMEGV